MRWYRVQGRGFVAALRTDDTEMIVETAPILDWVLFRRDRSLAWFRRYAHSRRWQIDELAITPTPDKVTPRRTAIPRGAGSTLSEDRKT